MMRNEEPELADHGGKRESAPDRQGDDVSLTQFGNNATYLTRRLKRDAPEIASALAAGEYPSARFRLDCMRKAGALLRETVRPRGAGNRLLPDDIEKKQSSRWQKVAQIEDELSHRQARCCVVYAEVR